MNNVKRWRSWAVLAFAVGIFLVLGSGCNRKHTLSSEGKLQIIATLFPQYDFAREIGGDLVEVSLLLPPGMESHSYDPTLADMRKISRADLLLYTGPQMEVWVGELIGGLEEAPVTIVDLSQGIALLHEEHHHGEEGHHHEGDPHIWTSPVLARKMVDHIVEALCQADPLHEEVYRQNGAAYCAKLEALDGKFRSLVAEAPCREIYFGGRFALIYFAEEYGLSYHAAFDSCSSETEPSFSVMASMIQAIHEEEIPVIYYEELSEPRIARAISEDTGAEPLLLHSCHNLSKAEWDQGCTYLSLMEQNLEHLRKGLYP